MDLKTIQSELTENLDLAIKSYYGIGGQSYSIYPIFGLTVDKDLNKIYPLMDNLIKELHQKQKDKNTTQSKGHSTLLTFSRSNKNYYTLLIQSEDMDLQTYNLKWPSLQSKLQYSSMELGQLINIPKGHSIITNITTNGGKIKGQQKDINTLFNLQSTKDIGPLYLDNNGHITYNNTTYKDIKDLTNLTLLNGPWMDFHKLIK